MARRKKEKELEAIYSQRFGNMIKKVKVPLLTVDDKWHALFDNEAKTVRIKKLESEVNESLKLQGKIVNEQKDLKKIKKTLMDGIIENIEGQSSLTEVLRVKKMKKSKQFIEEISDKLNDLEEEELDAPHKIREANQELMLATVEECHKRMRRNEEEVAELSKEVEKMKAELKQKVITLKRKEISNERMYSYLHGVLGHEFMEFYDRESKLISNEE